MNDDEVLDAQQAARFLRVSVQTVLKESRDGRLPGNKVGREWRYTRSALLDHLGRYVGEGTVTGGAASPAGTRQAAGDALE